MNQPKGVAERPTITSQIRWKQNEYKLVSGPYRRTEAFQRAIFRGMSVSISRDANKREVQDEAQREQLLKLLEEMAAQQQGGKQDRRTRP